MGEHPTQQIEGCSKELYEIEGFYRKEGGARKLLVNEKQRIVPTKVIFPWGRGQGGLMK